MLKYIAVALKKNYKKYWKLYIFRLKYMEKLFFYKYCFIFTENNYYTLITIMKIIIINIVI